jgi:Barrel-sandwich domain of CusB or HlyD membrane-fusion
MVYDQRLDRQSRWENHWVTLLKNPVVRFANRLNYIMNTSSTGNLVTADSQVSPNHDIQVPMSADRLLAFLNGSEASPVGEVSSESSSINEGALPSSSGSEIWNSLSKWRVPSIVEGSEANFPEKLSNEIDNVLGCSIWLNYVTRRGRVTKSFLSESASGLLLSSDELSAIASDASDGSTPIGTGCGPNLPITPSAIMDHVWANRPGLSSMSFPLLTPELTGNWVLTAAWRDETSQHTTLRVATWLDLNAHSIGQALQAWSLFHIGKKWQGYHKSLNKLFGKPLRWIACVAIVFFCLMLVPVPYRPTRSCSVEPSCRRYIASPIEGRIKSILVRPGDEVKAGQLLGKIDDSQILRDLAAAQAELQTHSKKRDIALATRAAGDLRIAQLECQQAQLKIDSLTEQMQRLEIVSPVDGVLVQGDWYGNEGMPVTFGQSLFEVAPLDRMIAEVHLNAEDLTWVHVGSNATLRSETSLTQKWHGTIARMEPQAEVIEDQAVFIGEMEIENTHRLFRPGMKAEVVVNAGNKSLGWVLFRKPYQWLQNQWIW